MRIRKILLGLVAVVVGLPLLGGLIAVAWISALDRTNGSIVSSGVEREYLLHVPESYDPAAPTPLVISLHAGATWPAHQSNLTRWNRQADREGILVVYPAGNPQLLGVARIWHSFEPGPGLERDVRFVADLIDELQAAYAVDPARIYVDGMSNGGGMAFVLSCALSDRIAAVGLVAPAQSLPSDWCRDARPVPMLAFHGTADELAPYDGGPMGDPFNPVRRVFPAVRGFVADWAERNRCAADPVESPVAHDVTRLEYRDCAEGAGVALYTLRGGGHSWPGGKPPPEWRVGPTNTSIDATAAMWEHFREHSR